MNEYEQLDTLLSNADWYYMRSDDDRAYKRGLAAMTKLIEMRDNLPDQDKANEIWDNHNPFVKYREINECKFDNNSNN